MFKTLLILLTLFPILSMPGHGQLVQNLNRQIDIPNIIDINSSETHLYALSESEGLVVFRTYSDSLQWLYSSTGMQERGHTLDSDIRFAYLYGDSRRLTVIEPTSVLGVYSSTILPSQPLTVERIGFKLFVALNNGTLGSLNLETPESVDTDWSLMNSETSTVSMVSDNRNTLYILRSGNELAIYEVNEDEVELLSVTSIDRNVHKIFLTDGELLGSDNSGNIFYINSNGQTQSLSQVSGQVDRILNWNDRIIIRTASREIWVENSSGNLERWKTGERSGNYITLSDSQLWISENSAIAPVMVQTVRNTSSGSIQETEEFRLKEIQNIVLPFPRSLILPVEFEGNVDLSQITFSYSAPFDNARIRGNTFYWQPTATQTGRHSVTITATKADGNAQSRTFMIDLRSFNAPPQFSPSRPITIVIGEEFDFQISAVDPDGIDQQLIRYLGVDLPNGAQIEEQTGVFRWTPNIRQVGEHRFQIIATDQYGAAASQNYVFNVIELNQEELEEDLF
tara:strand:+ start:27859 stop:29388 length:1530 start_codon:yes stop_codon:yes gene_type:complete